VLLSFKDTLSVFCLSNFFFWPNSGPFTLSTPFLSSRASLMSTEAPSSFLGLALYEAQYHLVLDVIRSLRVDELAAQVDAALPPHFDHDRQVTSNFPRRALHDLTRLTRRRVVDMAQSDLQACHNLSIAHGIYADLARLESSLLPNGVLSPQTDFSVVAAVPDLSFPPLRSQPRDDVPLPPDGLPRPLPTPDAARASVAGAQAGLLRRKQLLLQTLRGELESRRRQLDAAVHEAQQRAEASDSARWHAETVAAHIRAQIPES
jgi:hypothetical protein